MKKALALLIVLLAANALAAKSKRFVWEDEICAYEGWYNGAVYSERQLENTYRLWYSRDFELEVFRGERSNSQGLREPFTLAWLDYQYALKSTALRKLKIVNVPYWRNVKQKKLEALEQKYLSERRAFQSPEDLKTPERPEFNGEEGVMHENFRKLFRRVRRLGCDYA